MSGQGLIQAVFVIWKEWASMTLGDRPLLALLSTVPVLPSLSEGGNAILQADRTTDERAGIQAAEPAWLLRQPLQPCIS